MLDLIHPVAKFRPYVAAWMLSGLLATFGGGFGLPAWACMLFFGLALGIGVTLNLGEHYRKMLQTSAGLGESSRPRPVVQFARRTAKYVVVDGRLIELKAYSE